MQPEKFHALAASTITHPDSSMVIGYIDTQAPVSHQLAITTQPKSTGTLLTVLSADTTPDHDSYNTFTTLVTEADDQAHIGEEHGKQTEDGQAIIELHAIDTALGAVSIGVTELPELGPKKFGGAIVSIVGILPIELYYAKIPGQPLSMSAADYTSFGYSIDNIQ